MYTRLTGKMPLTVTDIPLSSSLSRWFGQELEVRGIDAMVYTRYILSILQQDDLDIDVASYAGHNRGGGSQGSNVKVVGRGGVKRTERYRRRSVDVDMLKKNAAVECLLSVTDENSGIESLVDELYKKLKEQERSAVVSQNSDQYESSDSVISTSPEDPTERYYAAFPALSDKCEAMPPPQSTKPVWSKMAKRAAPSNVGTVHSDSEEIPETVKEFERLERETASAEKRYNRKAVVSPNKGKNRSSKHHSVSSGKYEKSPRKEFRQRSPKQGKGRSDHKERHVYNPVKTVDQIKGKAIFQDVEEEEGSNASDNRSMPVVLRRGDITPSPATSFNPTLKPRPTVAFIVPKLTPSRRSTSFSPSSKETSPDPTSRENTSSKLSECIAFPVEEVDDCADESTCSDVGTSELVTSTEEENLLWYMTPLDDLVPVSPPPKDRLYQRKNSLEESQDEAEGFALAFQKLRSPDGGCGSQVDEPAEACTNRQWSIEAEDGMQPSNNAENNTPQQDQEDFPYLTERQLLGSLTFSINGGKKRFDCDSGNETDEQEIMEKARAELASDSEPFAEAERGLRGEFDEEQDHVCIQSAEQMQSEDTRQLLLTAINNLSNSSQELLPWFLSVNDSEEVSEEACLCRGADTRISPRRDLSEQIGLDGEDTGIPTPQSTENDVLNEALLFNLSCSEQSETDEQTVFQEEDLCVNSMPVCSSPEPTSPNLLTGLGFLWSDTESPSDLTQEQKTCQEQEGSSLLCEQDKTCAKDSLVCDNDNRSSLNHLITSLSNISSSSSLAPNVPCFDYATTYSGNLLLHDNVWSFPGSVYWPSDPMVTVEENSPMLFNLWLSNNTSQTYLFSQPIGSCQEASSVWKAPSFSPCRSHDRLVSQIWDINSQKLCSEETSFDRWPLSSSFVDKSPSYRWNINLPSEDIDSDCLVGNDNGDQWSSGPPGTKREVWHSILFDYDTVLQDMASKNPLAHLESICSSTSIEGVDVSPALGQIDGRHIVPSENSAFTSSAIPPKLAPLGHVKSEPVLPTQRSNVTDMGRLRLVEVKHLYMSDTSILRQLGLSTESDEEPLENADQLEYTPERFFHPIQVSSNSKSNSLCKSSSMSVSSSEDYSLISSSFGSTSFQHYCTEDTDKISFVPRFRLQRGLDKCAQTAEGQVTPPPGSPNADADKSLTERLLHDMESVLNSGEEDASLDLNMIATDAVLDGVGTSVEPVVHMDLANLWKSWDETPVQPESETSGVPTETAGAISTIWGMATFPVLQTAAPISETALSSCTEVPEAGKQTEEDNLAPKVEDASCTEVDESAEILAEPCTILPDETVGTQPEEACDVFPEFYPVSEELLPNLPSETAPDQPTLSPGEEFLDVFDSVDDIIPGQPWSRGDDVGDEVCGDDAMEFNMLMFAGELGQLMPSEAPYLSDLEESWMTSAPGQFEVQVPRKDRHHQGGGKKPCTFFMEGSCRRSDCKFSHDFNSITCRFWEQGSCFKGVTCPFLHGYVSDSSVGSTGPEESFLLNKDDFPHLKSSKKKENHKKRSAKTGFRRNSGPGREDEVQTTRSLPIDIKFKHKSS